MMYLIDLPSLSSLNLETHSGETETLVEGVMSVERVGLWYSSFFLVFCTWNGKAGRSEDAYPDLLCETVS